MATADDFFIEVIEDGFVMVPTGTGRVWYAFTLLSTLNGLKMLSKMACPNFLCRLEESIDKAPRFGDNRLRARRFFKEKGVEKIDFLVESGVLTFLETPLTLKSKKKVTLESCK
jgi:hypothetical protein